MLAGSSDGSKVLCDELVFSLWTIYVLGWAWKIKAFVVYASGVWSVAVLCRVFPVYLRRVLVCDVRVLTWVISSLLLRT